MPHDTPLIATIAIGLGLAHGVKLKNTVKAGQPVKWSDVAFDPDNAAIKFRREMEAGYLPKRGAKKG